MTENMARLERTIRMLVSAMLLIYGFVSASYITLTIGLIILATALIGWCPISWVAQRIMLKSRH